DQLGADVNRPGVAADLAGEQLARLPLQHLVRETLERLPEHHELAGYRVARSEMQVREPAVPPAVSPLGGKDDQVERLCALHLEPRGTAVAGFVRRIECFGHHTLVAA